MPDPARPVVAVVGGGITGLAAAWELLRERDGAGQRPAVVLYEAADRLGGRIETVHFAGHPVDVGVDAFLTRTSAAEDLCRELGLGDELVPPAAAEASLYLYGRLRPLPRRLVLGIPTAVGPLRGSGVLSRRGLLRVAADRLLPSRVLPDGGDPSVGEVVGRRLGREAVERLVDPLIGGINAGDVDHLSLSAVAPQVAAKLAGRRSLLRALSPPAETGGAATGPMFLGLTGGLGTLVERLATSLQERGARLCVGQGVQRIRHSEGGYTLDTGDSAGEATAVIVALPAHAAAPLLQEIPQEAADELAAIRAASVALVTLAWATNAAAPLRGTGFLVPRSEGLLLTAGTHTSVKWPHASVPGRIVVRGSFGKAGDGRAASLTDRALVARARQELGAILHVTDPPLAVMLRRFPQSFPQYEPGHRARVERVRVALGACGLAVAGAAYDGIGIPSCIASGVGAAHAVLEHLGTVT